MKIINFKNINSIRYELETGQYHQFLCGDINIEVYDYYFGKKLINYIIYPESGLITIFFYIEYLYNISSYLNQLKYFPFDNSIYSLNLKINLTHGEILNFQRNNQEYLAFQILPCVFQKDFNISFRLGNITLKSSENNNDIIIKKISNCNSIGYVKLDKIDNNLEDNFYINILKPYQFYMKYYYTSVLNDIPNFPNNYNINVEKNSDGKTFMVSFDCFLKDVKTNYTILIINKNEIKNKITTECEFLLSIENKNNSKKYINFIDNNENMRIKKEISFENLGNYEIFIMAQSLTAFSIFRFLGSESYSFTEGFKQKDEDEERSINIAIIIVIILFGLLILLSIFLIVFRYQKKKKLIGLINSINESKILFNDKNSDNNDELSTANNSEKTLELIEKPKSNNYIENIEDNNDIEEELDSELLSQPPAPALGNTFFSEEDRIRYELKKLNQSSNNKNNENDKEKKYINTNMGEE